MAKYLLIESRDPFEYGDPEAFSGLALDLAGAGNEVTFFLVQNGTLAARRDAATRTVRTLVEGGKMTVIADEFSLRERAIWPDRLTAGVGRANIDQLVDLLVNNGRKAIWH